jgi:hypothetical protein
MFKVFCGSKMAKIKGPSGASTPKLVTKGPKELKQTLAQSNPVMMRPMALRGLMKSHAKLKNKQYKLPTGTKSLKEEHSTIMAHT